jgi:hypothetical protein
MDVTAKQFKKLIQTNNIVTTLNVLENVTFKNYKSLVTIPNDTHFEKDLTIINCPNFKNIGKGVSVYNLSIEDCHNFTYIDDCLKAVSMKISKCPSFESLGNKIRLGAGAYSRYNTTIIDNCPKFKHIGKEFKVRNEDLNIKKCPTLENLPEDMSFKGNLLIEDSGVKSIPQTLKSMGVIYLEDCPNLTTLPNPLKTDELCVDNCPISSYEGITIKDYLTLSNQKQYTPFYNIKGKYNISLDDTTIYSIPIDELPLYINLNLENDDEAKTLIKNILSGDMITYRVALNVKLDSTKYDISSVENIKKALATEINNLTEVEAECAITDIIDLNKLL